MQASSSGSISPHSYHLKHQMRLVGRQKKNSRVGFLLLAWRWHLDLHTKLRNQAGLEWFSLWKRRHWKKVWRGEFNCRCFEISQVTDFWLENRCGSRQAQKRLMRNGLLGLVVLLMVFQKKLCPNPIQIVRKEQSRVSMCVSPTIHLEKINHKFFKTYKAGIRLWWPIQLLICRSEAWQRSDTQFSLVLWQMVWEGAYWLESRTHVTAVPDFYRQIYIMVYIWK